MFLLDTKIPMPSFVLALQIRNELEKHMNCNLKEFKEFIDNEMLLILGQMDKPSLIFDHLYLVSVRSSRRALLCCVQSFATRWYSRQNQALPLEQRLPEMSTLCPLGLFVVVLDRVKGIARISGQNLLFDSLKLSLVKVWGESKM